MAENNVIEKLGYRRIILDYHFSEFPVDVLTKVDANSIVEAMLEANASALMMYTKDHWGNIYSETKQGKKHKSIDYDLFGQVLAAGKEKGLVVYAYYTVCWDEHYARNYPEWCSRDSSGNIICNNGTNRWKSLCINSPYRDITFYQVEELIKNYDFPALFVDLVNYYYGSNSAPCFCEHCKKLWKAEYGYDMPEALQGNEKLQYLKFRDKFVINYLKIFKKIIDKSGKNIAFTHNFGVDFQSDDYVSKEAEPWGFDYYSGSITCKVFRSFGDGKSGELVTARFNQFWDFTIKSEEQLVWEGATALAHNQAILLIDQPNIDGSVEKSSINIIKKVFNQLACMESTIKDSMPYSEVGLFYSLLNQEMLNDKTYYTQYEEDFIGAYKMLTEIHIPFDVITENRLREEVLRKFKVIVIPCVEYIPQEKIKLLRGYVKQGGVLIFDYRTATKSVNGEALVEEMKSFGFVDVCLESPYTYNFVGAYGNMNLPYIRVNNGCVYASAIGDNITVSKTYLPAFDAGQDKWVSHNVQPGRETFYPGIVTGTYGLGSFIYYSFKMFTEYLHQGLSDYRKGFVDLLAKYYTPGIKIHAPSCVETNFIEKDGALSIVFTNCSISRPAGDYRNGGGTYHVNMDEVIPIYGIKIEVNGERGFTTAESLHNGKLIYDNNLTFTLDRLDIFDVITLKTEAKNWR